ncbi:MAG TPA: AMP-binding protein [Solirubrobacteraceae bacterium]|jgi:fatty-acyl-CoA synthase|nr:AMP-binding protein [Solirubrobacteraceae bacterium]
MALASTGEPGADLLERLERGGAHGATLTVIDRDGDTERTSFAAVMERGERIARGLRDAVGPADTVGVVLSSSIDCAASLIGVLRAGLTLASFPARARAMSVEQHALQVGTLCAATGAGVLLADRDTLAKLTGLPVRALPFDALDSAGATAALPDRPGKLVQFTSGSTSAPKGIQLPLDRVGTHLGALIERFGLRPGEAVSSWLPLSHDMGLIGAFFTTWAAGAHLTLIDPQVFVWDPSIWMRTCAETSTVLTWGPNFGFMLAARTARRLSGLSLAPLRCCVVGAEPVQAPTLRTFAEATAPFGFRAAALTPGYGLAEATLGVCTALPGEMWRSARVDPVALGEGDWREAQRGTEIVSVGVPVPGVEVRLAPGASDVAEIQVKGPSLLESYLGATLELADGEWLRTGDLGALADGELYVCGRHDDVLIVAGRNLYAQDLELTAAEHPAVRVGNCVAAQRDDGRYVIVAEWRRSADRELMQEASSWIQQELTARFGTGPADVAMIAPGTLPKTPSGKLARRATAKLYHADELQRVS